uniref:Uncharacterized protein n=1 Tax=Haptolina brevifila TaxID=156173 RepID=A0A7S2JKG5_9EUKA
MLYQRVMLYQHAMLRKPDANEQLWRCDAYRDWRGEQLWLLGESNRKPTAAGGVRTSARTAPVSTTVVATISASHEPHPAQCSGSGGQCSAGKARPKSHPR